MPIAILIACALPTACAFSFTAARAGFATATRGAHGGALLSRRTVLSAADVAFLEENRAKDGVVELPSGLQYRVLEKGAGEASPSAGTPCACHYEGKLIDGTKFDSSYERGTPTTFAPNQVIKGWTEAMQLMKEGDKWEMAIPSDLAYGPAGRPPKIPPAATLVFVMELVKIEGAGAGIMDSIPSWDKMTSGKFEAKMPTLDLKQAATLVGVAVLMGLVSQLGF
jgi:FKBP-type peptidyl-prolyl cis-trans isomerase FklB